MDIVKTYKDIKDFDIIHVRGQYWLAILIRFFQQLRWGKRSSYYNHSAFALWHGSELYIYEANPEVKKTRYCDWAIGKEICVSRLPYALWDIHGGFPAETKAIVKSKIGTRYDYISLLLIQVVYLFTGRWFGSKNSNSFYCSEYVAWMIYVSFGILPEWYKMNPASLFYNTEQWSIYRGKSSDLVNYSYKCKIK